MNYGDVILGIFLINFVLVIIKTFEVTETKICVSIWVKAIVINFFIVMSALIVISVVQQNDSFLDIYLYALIILVLLLTSIPLRFKYEATDSYFIFCNGIYSKRITYEDVSQVIFIKKKGRISTIHFILNNKIVALRNDFPIDGMIKSIAKKHHLSVVEE